MLKEIQKAVEDQIDQIIKTISDITKIDRGSKYLPGLRRIADYIEAILREMGCSIEKYDSAEYGPTLVGRKKGTGKAVIFLYAHMDTVWPEGTCSQRPFRVIDNFAYGPGVSDCTHGIIGQLYTLSTLNRIHFTNYSELILLFNPDEELYSPESFRHIAKYARLSDVAFCMESVDKEDGYITSRGGVIFYDIHVSGIKSHAGCFPERGRNAIEELCHKVTLVNGLRIVDAYPHTTLINGGISEGIVPDTAWAHIDFRVDTMEAIEALRREMNIIEKSVLIEGTTTQCIQRAGGCLPLIKTQQVEKFCQIIEEVSTEAKFPLHEEFCGGGANAVISAMEGVPTIDGLTPTSYNFHTNDEKLDLNTIVPRISILAEVIRRICIDGKYLREKG